MFALHQKERNNMHSFLKAIGFDQLDSSKLRKILNLVVDEPNYMNSAKDSNGNEFIEISKDFGKSIGITICGSYSEDGKFETDYYYPYFQGSKITSEEYIDIEKRSDKESYAAVCDEIKVGVTLIFHLQNTAEYLKNKSIWEKKHKPKMYANISALSLDAKILFPINKSKKQIQKNEEITQNRNHLLAAAREGDEDAIESLTLEDIDMYSMLSRRIVNEDMLSIVDSYFMPYGIECDKYSILGEIEACYLQKNSVTEEEIYVLTINCNDLIFDVGINKKDLWGEPKPGRRFKGIVWLQGYINFPN